MIISATIIIGFVVMIVTLSFDYRYLKNFSIFLYGVGIILLLAVFFFGSEKNSEQGWLDLPMGMSFQPAELMKLLLILFIGYMLARSEGETLRLGREVVPIGLVVLLPSRSCWRSRI